MPVTTYLTNTPTEHKDKELAGLIQEANEKAGGGWSVETIYQVEKKLFRKPVDVEGYTRLYKHQASIEHQVFTCVNTIREAKAYLFGLLNNV